MLADRQLGGRDCRARAACRRTHVSCATRRSPRASAGCAALARMQKVAEEDDAMRAGRVHQRVEPSERRRCRSARARRCPQRGRPPPCRNADRRRAAWTCAPSKLRAREATSVLRRTYSLRSNPAQRQSSAHPAARSSESCMRRMRSASCSDDTRSRLRSTQSGKASGVDPRRRRDDHLRALRCAAASRPVRLRSSCRSSTSRCACARRRFVGSYCAEDIEEQSARRLELSRASSPTAEIRETRVPQRARSRGTAASPSPSRSATPECRRRDCPDESNPAASASSSGGSSAEMSSKP